MFDTTTRDVVHLWQDKDKIAFQCPCGLRTVYVYQPPHGIAFGPDGLLTITGSVGFKGGDTHPDNWCHFDLTGGVPTMYSDASCPGSGKGEQ